MSLVYRHPHDVTVGLIHALLCYGSSRRDVYRFLYVRLKAAGVGGGIRTFVYPKWVRDIVRERFGASAHSADYDEQYDNAAAAQVYRVTEVDLSLTSFDADDDCPLCDQPMPSTP